MTPRYPHAEAHSADARRNVLKGLGPLRWAGPVRCRDEVRADRDQAWCAFGGQGAARADHDEVPCASDFARGWVAFQAEQAWWAAGVGGRP